ncbi:hypothetical protein GCM10022251_22890 [Phytohabitans flavus]
MGTGEQRGGKHEHHAERRRDEAGDSGRRHEHEADTAEDRETHEHEQHDRDSGRCGPADTLSRRHPFTDSQAGVQTANSVSIRRVATNPFA